MPSHQEDRNQHIRPEFVKLDLGHIKKNKVGFFLQQGFQHSEDLTELKIRLLDVHLFFYLNGDQKKIYRSTEQNREINASLSKIVIVPEHCFIIDEAIIDILLQKSSEFPDQAIVGFEDLSHPFLLNLDLLPIKSVNEIDELSIDVDKMLKTTLPNFGLHFFSETDGDCDAFVQEQKRKVEKHFKRGFDKVFLFNTEGYKDIDDLPRLLRPAQVIGLASGFKFNYMAEKFKLDTPQLVCLDGNTKALALKRKMIEAWMGDDFSQWIEECVGCNEDYSERYAELRHDLWGRELKLWSNKSSWASHWDWFKNQPIVFQEIDLVHDIRKLKTIIVPSGDVVFWISNIWHNEFLLASYNRSQLWQAYTLWIQELAEYNPDILLVQSEILGPEELYHFRNQKVKDILRFIKESC